MGVAIHEARYHHRFAVGNDSRLRATHFFEEHFGGDMSHLLAVLVDARQRRIAEHGKRFITEPYKCDTFGNVNLIFFQDLQCTDCAKIA